LDNLFKNKKETIRIFKNRIILNKNMEDKKRGLNVLIVGSIILLLTLPFMSSGIFTNFYNKLTGRATSGTASLNITVAAYAPTIIEVREIAAQNPTESGTTVIIFNFTAYDGNGVSYLDDATAEAYFQRAGQTTRSNTSCFAGASSANYKNYTCSIAMYYFDQTGAWTVNASIVDINGVAGENTSTTFTYNQLAAMTMSPGALSWATVNLATTDTGASNNPIVVNNTGNKATSSLNLTAYNLMGETTATHYIYAGNFSVGGTTAGCSGVVMSNATSKNITGVTLVNGNNSIGTNNTASGQAPLYFCLKAVPQTISSQAYSSGVNAWNVAMI
jgi:hypothetical protein